MLGRLFDEDGPTGNLHLIKIYKSEDNNIGFCIRGGLEHGLGVYVSGVDKGSAAGKEISFDWVLYYKGFT